jgi:hypothetical protein
MTFAEFNSNYCQNFLEKLNIDALDRMRRSGPLPGDLYRSQAGHICLIISVRFVVDRDVVCMLWST